MNHKLILDLLLAAGHVSQQKVDEASAIVEQFSRTAFKVEIAYQADEPEDHRLTFPEILRPYLRVATNRTCYEARKEGASMRCIAKALDITHQAVSYACNAFRKKHGLQKYPRYKGSNKVFKTYYEVNMGFACYELHKQGMEYHEIKKLTGLKNSPASSACQYAKNYNQPWPITFAG